MVSIASRTIPATRRTVSQHRHVMQIVASSRFEDESHKFREIRAMS